MGIDSDRYTTTVEQLEEKIAGLSEKIDAIKKEVVHRENELALLKKRRSELKQQLELVEAHGNPKRDDE
jgi:SMC interacting uncharacterized protein involved in chromosome segregation